MAPPWPLAIASSSVQRLLKEEGSYHKELADQEARVKALDSEIQSDQVGDDGNAEFMLKQQRTAVEQTKAVFGPLRIRLAEAVAKLEEQIAASDVADANAADLEQARSILAQAKAL